MMAAQTSVTNSKLELLAPAGDIERLRAALLYGADAVYLGAEHFGMRATSKNFTMEHLTEAVTLCHACKVRVYLTVNTIPHPDEADMLPNFMREAAACGVDAMIVADLGVIALARRLLPGMELHASTQLGVTNHLTARTLWEMGVTRVVLARELSLDEISTIRAKTPAGLTLEAFVHGAMCMSISGRCVISNYLTGRDANRGQCAQPCRWNYALMEEKRPGLYLPVCEEEGMSSLLSARDLCMIEHLEAIKNVGVTSFKLEGRVKSAYYVGVITNAYRAALDALAADKAVPVWALREVDAVSHREYSTGFYFGENGPLQTYVPESYLQEWEVSGVVERCEEGRLYLSERNAFSEGDQLELLYPNRESVPLIVQDLRDETGEPLLRACHPLMRISLSFHEVAAAGCLLRRRKNK